MDERRLEAFVTVARERSFTRAASLLHLSQSAVSQQIAALEQELGAQLFERTRREVILTLPGQALLERAVTILAESLDARTAVAAAQTTVSGTLRIIASLTIGGYIVPRRIAEFRRRHEQARVSLEVANTETVVRVIRDGRADIGFIEGGETEYEGIRMVGIGRDELAIICSVEDLAARDEEMTLEALQRQRLVLREVGSGTRQVAEEHLARQGVDIEALNIVAEISNFEAIKSAVEAGLGVSIMSLNTVRKELRLGTLVARPLEGPPIMRDLAAVFAERRPTTPAATAFLGLVLEPGRDASL